MLTKEGKRALAYIANVDNIQPIDGADNIELISVLGWKVIAKKFEFKIGDKCVFFEIDSKLPVAEWSEFMSHKHYKVKTMKLNKFGVVSQGLALPITLFPEISGLDVGEDVTDILKITYADPEDNKRKNNNPNAKYESMKSRHKKLFKKSWIKWLMKREWGRKLLFFFFGKKRDNPRSFPSFISKTDEERIENVPWRLEEDRQWIVTEKLDGTSCTYALERKKKNKFEFYVCSRNVRQADENQKCYHERNIYWDLAFRYNIEEHLKEVLQNNPDMEWVVIQGEGVGSVQGNPLKLSEDDLYVFNYITSTQGRYNSYAGRTIIESWGMKWVPIYGIENIPKTMEEMKALADGPSILNPNVLREGFVYRSLDGVDSFKNVSNKFLLSKKD